MSFQGSHSGIEILFLAMAEVLAFSQSLSVKEGIRDGLSPFYPAQRGYFTRQGYVVDLLLVLVSLLVQRECECKVD